MSARDVPSDVRTYGEAETALNAHRLMTRLRPFGYPLLVYLGSRLVVLTAAYFAAFMKMLSAPRSYSVRVFTSWDGEVYRMIAQHGYPATLHARPNAYRFSPLYPLVLRSADVVSPLTGRENATLVSTVLGLVAALGVWHVARSMFGRDVADRAVLLFCFLPGAFVLSFAYPDALLLVLAITCLACLTRRRWVAAGIAGALATATSPAGLVLVVCATWAAVASIRRRHDLRALCAPAIAVSGFVAFVLYAAARTGEPDAWFLAQRGGWRESFDAGAHFLSEVGAFLSFSRREVDDVFFIVTAVTIIGGLYLLARARLPVIYTVFTVAVLVPALTAASTRVNSTVVVLAFPLTIAAARRLRDEVAWATAATLASVMALSVVWLAWQPRIALP